MVTHGMLVYVPGTGSNGSSRWFAEGWGKGVSLSSGGATRGLYQYSINMKYKQAVFEGSGRKGGWYKPCGSVLHSLRSPRKPNAPSKPSETLWNPLKRTASRKTRKVVRSPFPPSSTSRLLSFLAFLPPVSWNAKRQGNRAYATCLSLSGSVLVNCVLISDEGLLDFIAGRNCWFSVLNVEDGLAALINGNWSGCCLIARSCVFHGGGNYTNDRNRTIVGRLSPRWWRLCQCLPGGFNFKHCVSISGLV